MKRLAMLCWQLEVAAVRHGLWALPGAAALLLALAAWLVWIPAREAELAQALAALAQRQSAVPPPALPPAPALPVAGRADAALRQLFALAAEQGLQVSQADYRRQDSAQIGRWQVQLPATGRYPQVRRFVRAATAIPGVSLDEIALHPAGAGRVEARLLLSIWFSAGAR